MLKTFLPNGLGDKYLQANPEDVAIAYEQIIVEMLMLSARATQSWITSAVLKTYQTVGSSEAKSFGQQLAQTCQYCLRKKLQVTTGEKGVWCNEKDFECDFLCKEASKPR